MPALNIRSIKETILWKRLDQGFKNTAFEELATELATHVATSCDEAADRMKAVPLLMPQYTLHDQVHLLRVTELMARIAGSVVERLNPAELALAILSANFHDHGMVLSGEETAALEQNPAFRIFSENWKLKNPNLREVETRLGDTHLSGAARLRISQQREELLRAMITEFVRQRHAQKSREFVNMTYGRDRRWEILGSNIAKLVGLLCESHMREARWLKSENGFHHDQTIGTIQANVQYIGILLRLADILDFDRDRTPDILYRSIHFSNDISIQEWEKHRSVQGWTISPELIRFTIECEHPAYERTARVFMDWIDKELADSHAIVRSFPGKCAEHYPLPIPTAVDRTRIGPKNNSYKYHDLEFSLSREDVVQLLMTDKLYQSPSLCIRELLQNSLDALRHRHALYAKEKMSGPAGFIHLEHELDKDGYEIIRCSDNGVGMDEHVIEQFLTRVGRSYYRSPEFDQERNAFRSADVDFDPCAKFGIGFMSCFMLGDRILIHTRRDFGPGNQRGEPLIVEISGLGGLIVIRKGSDSQPDGTTVAITSRRKPGFLDEWADNVRLLAVVRGYALATEFKIQATTKIDEIAGCVEIDPGVANRGDRRALSDIAGFITLKQDFRDVEPQLGGSIWASFLKDAMGNPTLANDEARIEFCEEDEFPSHLRLLPKNGNARILARRHDSVTCIDGILVAGEPGRTGREYLLPSYSNPIHLPEVFVLDIRGRIKPELTPARTPPDNLHRSMLGWRRIQKLAFEAHGKLWGRIGSYIEQGMSCAAFWELAAAYGASLKWTPSGILWEKISVPVLDDKNSVEWVRFCDLGPLMCIAENDSDPGKDIGANNTAPRKPPKGISLKTTQNQKIGFAEILNLQSLVPVSRINSLISDIVIRISSLVLHDGQIRLQPTEPKEPELPLARYELAYRGIPGGSSPIPLIYSGPLNKYLTVEYPISTINRQHRLYSVAFDSDFVSERSELQIFAHGLIHWISNPEVLEILFSPQRMLRKRGLKWLGQAHRAVNWRDFATDFAPPFSAYSPGKGTITITEDHLARWADLALKRDLPDEDVEAH